MLKLAMAFLFLFYFGCKENWEKGDIKYLPKDWDNMEAINQEGKTISLTSLRGKFKIIYFGFSHCPDMCPMALSNLAKAMEVLNRKHIPFHIVFISLDPERDTPEMLQKYAQMFPDQTMQAFTPKETDMMKLMETFGIFREKKVEGKGYTLNHSNFLFVLGRTNEQIATILGTTPPEEIARQIKEIIPDL